MMRFAAAERLGIGRRLLRLAVFGVLALAGCGREQDEPLRIALPATWPPFEFLHLAQDKGLFAAEGIEVELVQFETLPDGWRAYELNQVDGIGATIFEIVQSHSSIKRRVEICLATDFSDGADMIIGGPAVADLGALRGKRVALLSGSLDVFTLMRGLAKAGLTLDDVQTVDVPENGKAAALAAGRADAAVAYPPFSEDVLAAGGHIVFSSKEIPGEILDVIGIAPEIVRQRPGAVEKLIRAWDRAVAYAAAHPDEAYGYMGGREKMTAAEFQAALGGIRILSLRDQAHLFQPGAEIERSIDALHRLLYPDHVPSEGNVAFAGDLVSAAASRER